MSLSLDDPRLTAYVLGELSALETAEIEVAAAAEPPVAEEIQDIRILEGFLTDRFALPVHSLDDARRETILKAAREADRAAKLVPFRKFCDSAKPWIIPAAAAAVLTISTLIPDPPAKKVVAENAKPPAVVPPRPTPIAAPAAVPFVPRGSNAVATTPVLDLPILTSRGNYDQISNLILNDDHLPSPETVKPEEILNAFPLRLSGMTSIARSAATAWHPDTRSPGIAPPVATLSTELIACPWKPSATLLIISLRGNPTRSSSIKLAFHADKRNVFRYRLLGFTDPAGPVEKSPPTTLLADAHATYAIEIEPTHPVAELGSLVWSVDGNAAPTITLVHNREAEPSNDARFAATVCMFSQWLAHDQPAVIDKEVVAALARQTNSITQPKDRAKFFTLLKKALELK
jgi:hypothetical protein